MGGSVNVALGPIATFCTASKQHLIRSRRQRALSNKRRHRLNRLTMNVVFEFIDKEFLIRNYTLKQIADGIMPITFLPSITGR